MSKGIFILLLALNTCIVSAQESAHGENRMREILAQAENDYRIGRIEQARDALLHDLSGFHNNLRQNALRLIALSYLARFDMEHTQEYATLMLHENPYYTPSASDPPAFVDMVNSIKAGMTSISLCVASIVIHRRRFSSCSTVTV